MYKLFALLCFVFLGDAPIPYVQAAILNLPHPYFEVLPYFKINNESKKGSLKLLFK